MVNCILLFLLMIASVSAQEAIRAETSLVPDTTTTETYLLRYKFPPDRTARYQLVVDDWEKMKINGREAERKQVFVLKFEQKTESVDESGNGTWLQTYNDVSYQGDRVAGLIGREVRCRISPDGKILATEGLQNISNELAKLAQKSMAFYIPGFDRLPLQMNFSKMPSAAFNPMYQAFIPTFPDRDITIGETWSRPEDLSRMAGKRAGPAQYRLEAVDQGIARIAIGPCAAADQNAADRVTSTGVIYFSIPEGAVVKLDILIKMDKIKVTIDPAKVDPRAAKYGISQDISGNKRMNISLRTLDS